MSNGADNFYKSDKVTVEKVTFNNQYGMKVAGNLFTPKDLDPKTKNAAIIVGHPMGAVKDKAQTSTPPKWPSRDLSRCRWTCPSGRKCGHTSPSGLA